MDDVALTRPLIGLSHAHLFRVCVFYSYFTVSPQAFLLIGVALGSAKVFGSHRIFLASVFAVQKLPARILASNSR